MSRQLVPPPSPAVTHVASDNDLGGLVRGYVTMHEHRDSVTAHKRAGGLTVVFVLLVAALPLASMILVAWWLGLLVLAAGAIAITVWLARPDQRDLKPNQLVYQFERGLAFPTQEDAEAVRWDDVTSIYQSVTQNYLNGAYTGTGHTYHLVTAHGRHTWLTGGVDDQSPEKTTTDVAELADVLLAEITLRLLPPAAATVSAGGRVSFDDVTVGPDTIATPVGETSWTEVQELTAGGGSIFLRTAARKPWQHPIDKIPNFPVFWTLAQQLHAHARERA